MTPRIRVLVSIETDDRVGHSLLSRIDGVDVVPYDPNSVTLSQRQALAEVLIPPYRGSHRPIGLLPQLFNLRLVQLLTAGTDEWEPHIPSGIKVLNAGNAHAGPVSEWILSAILTQFRRWPTLFRFQNEQTWAHRKFQAETLSGSRVLIVGAGNIGTATAHKLKAFNAQVTLVGKTARKGVHGSLELLKLIPGQQVVVLATPLTSATTKMVDAEFLTKMETGSLLVNAGRGQLVDTTALLNELRTQRILAALDVTDPEPLPSDHPLWSAPGVIISPHSARTVPGTNELCYAVAASRLAEFCNR